MKKIEKIALVMLPANFGKEEVDNAVNKLKELGEVIFVDYNVRSCIVKTQDHEKLSGIKEVQSYNVISTEQAG